ncbi:MAG: hypothetical protein LPK19_03850 [Hymenobacteraceae bacterium]|nr:hypothetical protein [Hymenobacteraceae bacterium]MDX5511379.1 hypothetical protein [Hymenobacteraceae bacterium]
MLFEFKDLLSTKATVDTSYNQVQYYIHDIPQVFETNALTTLHGMFSSSREWFAAYISTDSQTIP